VDLKVFGGNLKVFGGVGWCLEFVGRVKSCLEWLVASNI